MYMDNFLKFESCGFHDNLDFRHVIQFSSQYIFDKLLNFLKCS